MHVVRLFGLSQLLMLNDTKAMTHANCLRDVAPACLQVGENNIIILRTLRELVHVQRISRSGRTGVVLDLVKHRV